MRIVDQGKARFAAARKRWGWLDHGARMQEHYSSTSASQQAGAVTYFGFLSIFPILALAFFVIGYVAKVYPNANRDLVKAIDQVMPHLVSQKPTAGHIALSTFQHSASTVGIVGIVGVFYAGLGWIDSLRTAMSIVFDIPRADQPNMIIGKLRDVATMMVLGVVLVASVGVTGVVRGLSERILGWIGLGGGADWLLWVLGIALGLAANAVLFYAMFTLLVRPQVSGRHLWAGAFLGAVGFEILKNISVYLLASAKGQPAFQVFGISLILLVWINYFSRVTLYAAAWAFTAERPVVPVGAPYIPSRAEPSSAAPLEAPARGDRAPLVAFGTGIAVALVGLLGWRELRRR